MATHKIIRWRLEERDLDELIEFPFQSAVFPDRPEEENQALDEDISKNGLKHPIEILPENTAGLPPDTILAGHRRKASLLRLGRRTSKVRVRYDLSRADRTEIEEFFIDDNDNRRHYSPLDRARIALRRFEMKRGVEPGELSGWDETEARKRIAKALNCHPRNASRYFAVLATPIEVQKALESKQLKLDSAAKVAGLPDDIQVKIAGRIGAGEEAKHVVESYIGKTRGKPVYSVTEFTRYLRSLENLLERFDDSVDEIGFMPSPGDLEMLEAGKSLHEKLIRRLRGKNKARSRAMHKLMEEANNS